MNTKNKSVGYYNFILALDTETSGLFFGQDDPSFNPKTNQYAQAVSMGLVVADAHTFTPIEKLYVEIKWDGQSIWDPKAEKVHGLSKQYLKEHGIEPWDAVEKIGSLVLQYFGPTGAIKLLGHNAGSFDIWFLKRLMRSEGIDLRFGSRHVDTSTLGHVVFGVWTSDELFNMVGLPDRAKHNALEDALLSLEAARRVQLVFKQCLGEE